MKRREGHKRWRTASTPVPARHSRPNNYGAHGPTLHSLSGVVVVGILLCRDPTRGVADATHDLVRQLDVAPGAHFLRQRRHGISQAIASPMHDLHPTAARQGTRKRKLPWSQKAGPAQQPPSPATAPWRGAPRRVSAPGRRRPRRAPETPPGRGARAPGTAPRCRLRSEGVPWEQRGAARGRSPGVCRGGRRSRSCRRRRWPGRGCRARRRGRAGGRGPARTGGPWRRRPLRTPAGPRSP